MGIMLAAAGVQPGGRCAGLARHLRAVRHRHGRAGLLLRKLPQRQPPGGMHYFELLASMWHLLKTTPILRRRAAYQAACSAPSACSGPAFRWN
jgi:hypothetical protein